MNKNCCKKIKITGGFSLLEKPFRSNRLFAMLAQSLTRSSHTKFRSPAAHLSGFSLAEALVMFVIVAILLALSAPLIAKRSSADAKRLVLPNETEQNLVNSVNGPVAPPAGSNFTSIFSAVANNQNFGIGTRTPNAKLHVQATNGDADILNVTAGSITLPAPEDNTDAQKKAKAANDSGLFVRQRTVNDGVANRQIAEVNILACVPDWGNIVEHANDAAVYGDIVDDTPHLNNVFLQDGYLVVNDDAIVGGIAVQPVRRITGLNCAANGACDNITFGTHSLILVPVSRRTSYNNIGTNQFIPCKQGYKSYGRNEQYVAP